MCSGIEAATVAWKPLGFEAVAFSEIEAFSSAVLKHHYPDVPNRGDMTKFQEWPDAVVDVLVGGTPCQSFSVAGLRAGLDDSRGSLMLTYLAIARRFRPRWLVWENVPGVLSVDDGRAFGSLLGGLAELGYGFAYRILDAQHFGLAQRRARVFVVGRLGDWRRAAAVLFERASLSGHPAPSREAGQRLAATLTNGFGERGVDADQIANGNYSLAPTIPSCSTAGGGLRTDFDGGVMPAIAFDARQSDVIQYGDQSWPLDTDGHTIAVAFAENQRAEVITSDTVGSLNVGGGKPGQGFPALQRGMQVRRLTPRECEKLQGFEPDYTLIPYRGKPAADGPRYKALGNSMAVPCMAWIGRRIQLVEAIGVEPRDELGLNDHCRQKG